jgi:hypothetical protein
MAQRREVSISGIEKEVVDWQASKQKRPPGSWQSFSRASHGIPGVIFRSKSTSI